MISSTTRVAGPYAGTGLQTVFPFAFKVFQNSDVLVVQTDAAGNVSTLVLTSGYNVALNVNQDTIPGGSITLVSAPAAGYTVTISSQVQALQGANLTNAGNFYPGVINNALDYLTILVQQLYTSVAGALRFPLGDPSANTTLPSAANRANKLLSFDTSGNPVAIALSAQSATALQASLAASTGAGLIGTIAPGSGAASRTAQAAFSDFVSVAAYRQTSDTDDYLSFSRAIAALPTNGGTIQVPDAAYVLASTPTWGTKSIMWNIGAGATFSGAGVGQGKFPYLNTNNAQLAVGPWIQSQSSAHSTNTNGGIAAFQVEMLQPSTYGVGQSVALYAGARGANANLNGNVWAANFLISADSGALGSFQCLELDVNTYASNAAATQGLLISGIGTVNPTYAIAMTRSDSTVWNAGLYMSRCNAGIVITNDAGMSRGIDIGNPTIVGNTTFSGKQLAAAGDILFGQRISDTTLTGNFLRLVNAANSVNLFNVDVSGNIGCGVINAVGNINTSGQIAATGNINGNIVTGANLRVTGGANPVSTGTMCLGATTATTSGAASGSFLILYVGATQYKLQLLNT